MQNFSVDLGFKIHLNAKKSGFYRVTYSVGGRANLILIGFLYYLFILLSNHI